MSTFSLPVRRLIQRYLQYLEEQRPDETPKIQVDEIAAKVASFYERVRGIVDYQESHLVRKNVISRALQRRIFLRDLSGKDIAEGLIKEIIRSGHVSNNVVSETKISETQKVVDTTIELLDYTEKNISEDKDGVMEWVMGVAVVAIEEILVSPEKEYMLAEAVFDLVMEKLAVQGEAVIKPEDQEVLLFISIQKALFKVDEDRLYFRLLRFLYPRWKDLDHEEPSVLGLELVRARDVMKRHLKHPHLPYFMRMMNRNRIVFYTLGDLIFEAKDLGDVQRSVAEVYQERYMREKSRLFKIAFFSVVSFFLSKILIALAIEVPIDVYVTHHFSLPHAAANVVFPPVLMLIIVLSIHLPSEKNLILVQDEVRKVFFGDPNRNYAVVIPRQKSFLVSFVVRTVYFVVFAAMLYYLSLLLIDLGFSVANIVVFVLFTSLVTATGVRIYNRARELSLEKEKPRFLMFLLDVITLPLVTLGKWVMAGLKHFNVLVIIFNFLIELPVQLFVEFLEHFNAFMKGKKEEIE